MKLYNLVLFYILFCHDVKFANASYLRSQTTVGGAIEARARGNSKKGVQLHEGSMSHRKPKNATESPKKKTDSVTESPKNKTDSVTEKPTNAKDSPKNTTEPLPETGIATLDKVLKTDIAEKVKKEYITVKTIFLPGMKFMFWSFVATIIALVVSIIWFAVYFCFIYENDYEEIDGGRWKKELETMEPVADVHNKNLLIRPDIMIVFHHPENMYSDQESEVTAANFDRVVVSSHIHGRTPRTGSEHREYLENVTALRKTKKVPHGRSFLHSATAQFTQSLAFGGGGGGDGGQSEDDGIKISYHQARIALLQDLYRDLYDLGFGLKVFSSIDNDEIFLGIQLRKAEVINHYLYIQQYSLRIKRDLIPKLGIAQPPDVVPPMLRFDMKTVEGLCQAGVIDSPEAREVFKSYSGGLLVSTRDRVRLIYGTLTDLVDLDAAKLAGFIVDWYPVHNPDWLPKLKATWANYSLLWDLSFVQPVLSLQSYFGVRVAFIFAWNGLYCKALLALLPLALLSESIGFVLRSWYGTANITRMMVLSFNIIIVVWGRIAYNIWEREHHYFMETWSMRQEFADYIIRPSFHGDWQPTVSDANRMEKQYPESKLALRRFFTGVVTVGFCGMVAAFIVVWYDIFQGRLTPVSTLSLMLQIKLFEFAWNAITPALTEFENHKYQFSFYNSYLWKNFIFQAVNTYSAYFYIAVKLQNSEVGCPDGSCLTMLRRLLIVIQIILSLGQIGWLILQSYWVKFVLWYEVYSYRKANNGEDPPERPPSESEAKMSEFRNREQIESMCQLMLSLGFILLFGAIAPVMVPFSLLVFSLNLRVNAVMLVTYMKRPIPRKQLGIGAWKDVVLILMRGGVFFSGFLLVVYGDTFRGVPLVTRMVGLLVYCLAMFSVWAIVDYVVPGDSKEGHDLQARHNAVLDRIHRRCQEKEDIEIEKEETLRVERKKSYFESPIARMAWKEIRPLAMGKVKSDPVAKLTSLSAVDGSASASFAMEEQPGRARKSMQHELSGELGSQSMKLPKPTFKQGAYTEDPEAGGGSGPSSAR